MIQDLLFQLGLVEKEVLVYLALLKRGRAGATNLARITKINRTTIYSIAKELIKKGLISEDQTTTPSTYLAVPPQDLKSLISQAEQQLKQRKNLIEQLIPELLTLSGDTLYSPPKIQFKSEDDLEEFLYAQSPVWAKSMSQYDNIWWGFQDPTFVEYYQQYIDWHWEQPDAKQMIIQLITTKSSFETQMQTEHRWPERRKIKIWPGAEKFTGGMWICGDYVILAVTQQKPHYLIEIFDRVLAHNLRTLFKGIWERLPDSP